MMDVAELRDLSVDDLEARAKELEDQLFRMRIQQSLGQLDAPLKLRFTRRDLARIKTVITEKQRAERLKVARYRPWGGAHGSLRKDKHG
jgi:large subunit ribosomal protein L29